MSELLAIINQKENSLEKLKVLKHTGTYRQRMATLKRIFNLTSELNSLYIELNKVKVEL